MGPVSSDGMACKLIVRRLEEGPEQSVEQTFDGARITIGRGVGNDLVLKDPTRVVSTKHAEICDKQGAWIVRDVGSTNGTILNGRKITPRQAYELHPGDLLSVGPYQLAFQAIRQQETRGSNGEAAPPVTAPSDTAATNPERLRYILQRACGEFDGSSGGDAESHLEAILRRAMQGCDRAGARSALQSLRTMIRSSIGQAGEVWNEAPASKPEALPADLREQDGRNRSLGGDQARQVYTELGVPGLSLDPDQMARRIETVLNTLCAGLADAVRGRREFQKEFEVEATRILAWTPNPIKHAESAAEIAAILLDPASCRLTDHEAIAGLREVLQDLTLHQLGLMAGFRECVRGLLKELDPEGIEKVRPGESKGKGIGLLSGRSIRAEAAAWRRYVETHRRLTDEEVKVFERILAPHFAKGYLAVHKTRKRS